MYTINDISDYFSDILDMKYEINLIDELTFNHIQFNFSRERYHVAEISNRYHTPYYIHEIDESSLVHNDNNDPYCVPNSVRYTSRIISYKKQVDIKEISSYKLKIRIHPSLWYKVEKMLNISIIRLGKKWNILSKMIHDKVLVSNSTRYHWHDVTLEIVNKEDILEFNELLNNSKKDKDITVSDEKGNTYKYP